MNEEKLRKIVQEMINNNEPDDKIREVVRRAREMMAVAVPDQEIVDQSIEADELPQESEETGGINWDMAKEMYDNIQLNNKTDEDKSMEVEVVADGTLVAPPNQAIQLIQEAEKSPIKAAAMAHAQDNYDRLSYVEKLDFSGEGIEASKKRNEEVLKPRAEELRHILSNINTDSDEFNNKLLQQSVSFFDDNVVFKEEQRKLQDDLSLFASSEDVAKGLNGRVPSGKMPEEMKRLMNSDGRGNFTNWKSPEEQLKVVTTWKEKPDWYPEDKWSLVQQFNETGSLYLNQYNSFISNIKLQIINNFLVDVYQISNIKLIVSGETFESQLREFIQATQCSYYVSINNNNTDMVCYIRYVKGNASDVLYIDNNLLTSNYVPPII